MSEKVYGTEPVELRVIGGKLLDVPLPKGEGGDLRMNWIASVTDKPQGQYSDTKKFWKGNEVPRGTKLGDVVMFDGLLGQSSSAVGRWRWIGVVVAPPPLYGRAGVLRLREFPTIKKAFQSAAGVGGPPLAGAGLEGFIRAIRDGDVGAVPMLCDWLQEQGDARAEMLKHEVLRLVEELFPEVVEPKKENPK